MSEDSQTVFARIVGRVQGVGFRNWVKQEADSRRLQGWVRNCEDGAVELLAHGTRLEVESLAKLLWEGPRFSVVKDVLVELRDAEACEDLEDPPFRVVF